jgi:hypothetical protein
MKGDQRMLKAIIASAVTAFFLIAVPCQAEFYKYVDKDGNVIFTDDLSKVPADQRQGLEEYAEPETPAPAQNTPEDNPEQKIDQPTVESQTPKAPAAAGGDLKQKKAELEAKQAKLDEQYNALMDEKKQLESDKEHAKSHKQIQAYNERVLQFSEKLNNYNEQRIAFEAEVKAYNAAVAPGNPQPEKKD